MVLIHLLDYFDKMDDSGTRYSSLLRADHNTVNNLVKSILKVFECIFINLGLVRYSKLLGTVS